MAKLSRCAGADTLTLNPQGFFTSNPTMMVTRDEVKSVMKGDDMTVYCAMSSKALGGI